MSKYNEMAIPDVREKAMRVINSDASETIKREARKFLKQTSKKK